MVETKIDFHIPQYLIFENCMGRQAPQQEDKLELKCATFNV